MAEETAILSAELNEVITFGRYRGQTKRSVLGFDASYLLWADKNVEWFKLSNALHELANEYVLRQGGNKGSKRRRSNSSVDDFDHDDAQERDFREGLDSGY